jgi:4-diphosphocytidyl-2-C-methyl-D-erythritol kinase
MEVKAYAKINWDLHVLGKRPDGYHALDTVMVNVSLYDVLSFEQAPEITLTCSDPSLPTDERNLVVKAARLLAKESGYAGGARIHLRKSIPAGGGMGGGSSDCASTLLALSKLWKLNLQATELHRLAADLGSDVAFFLIGGWCRCLGRGEIVERLPGSESWPALPLLLILPALHVSTPEVYRKLRAPAWDAKSELRVLTGFGKSLEFWHDNSLKHAAVAKLGLFNSLTEAACEVEPRLAGLQLALQRVCPGRWLMSGSGAVHFIVLSSPEEGAELRAKLLHEAGAQLRVLSTTTYTPLV